MAIDPITATNLANWIPTVWSKDVLAAVENSLVSGALVDRGYEVYARDGGDKIVVPNLANITPSAVNTAQDLSLYDTVQNVTNISINKKYDIGVAVDDINQLQTNPKYFDKVRSKLSYGLAKQIDTNVNALFADLDATKGSAWNALTEDVLIDSYEYLNSGNAPYTDRAWIFDPESISDLLKLDYFIRMDYVPGSVVSQGFQGRQIFGAPVYISTNLDTLNVNCHAAAYLQKEAIALVIQMPSKFEIARLPLRHSDAIIGLCVFGIQEMRGTFGVCINTRS